MTSGRGPPLRKARSWPDPDAAAPDRSRSVRRLGAAAARPGMPQPVRRPTTSKAGPNARPPTTLLGTTVTVHAYTTRLPWADGEGGPGGVYRRGVPPGRRHDVWPDGLLFRDGERGTPCGAAGQSPGEAPVASW